MTLPIESLRRKDIPQFIDLLRLGFQDDLHARGTDPARLSRVLHLLLLAHGAPLRVLRRLTGHTADLLVARSGDRLAACLAILGRDEPVLTGMYVLPEFRGQRLALAMVNEALDRLRSRGRRRATVLATDEAAQHLAERAGFVASDRTDLYRRRLPARITFPPRFTVERGRQGDLSGNPYDLGPLRRLTRVRHAGLRVFQNGRPVLSGTLTALPHQHTGELKPRLLVPGREEALLAALAAGSEWVAALGREEIYLPLSAAQEAFAPVALRAEFEFIRSWVHLERDLTVP